MCGLMRKLEGNLNGKNFARVLLGVTLVTTHNNVKVKHFLVMLAIVVA